MLAAIILTVALLASVQSQLFNYNSGNYCPYGSQPYAGGASTTCQSDGAICAAGYTCQRATSANYGSLYCCSSQAQGNQAYCPRGGQPNYISGGAATNQQVPQSCSSGACTAGYTCQPSSFGGLSYCCSNSASTSLVYNDGTNYNNNAYNNGYANTYTTPYPSYSNNYAASNTAYQNNNYATSNNGYPNSNTNYYANNNLYNNGNSNSANNNGFYYTTTTYPPTYAYASAYNTGNNNNGYNNNAGYNTNTAYNNGYNTNTAYNNGYNTNTAYNNGYNTASNNGYNTNTAYNNGYNTAYNNGYNTNTAYNTGYNTANTAYNTGYNTANNYNTGYNTGYSNSATASQYCPANSMPWYYPGTQYVPSCVVGISTCPYPSICQSMGTSSAGARGHCCSPSFG